LPHRRTLVPAERNAWGTSDPTLGMLTKLAKALGVTLAELLG
jgi:hypothetical protein